MALNKLNFYSTKLPLIVICMELVTSTKAQWLIDDDGCRTPDGGVGLCIPMNKCKYIEDFKQNSAPLSQFAMEKLQGYYCGVLNNSVKVCCPNSPILIERVNIKQPIVTEQPLENDCKTPDEAVGSCIPIRDCKPITDFIQKSLPLSQDTIKTVQGYKCEDIENSVKVCCPNSPILIERVNIKQPIVTEQPLEDDCKTPDEAVGSCIPIKDCKPIIDFIQKSLPLSQDTIKTVQGYKCEDIKNSVKICCPKSPIITNETDIKIPAVIEQPPDVTNHSNLNLLPYECGFQMGVPRITGGNKTVLFEFPWMALLSYQTGNGLDFRCGGTIINERYILTAAHCITNLRTLKLIGVRLGEYNISSKTDCETAFGDEYCAPSVQDIAVAESVPHPKYNSTSFTNDIGLIRLASPINTAVENAKPICLPVTETLRNKNFINAPLTVTGWGATETGRKSADLLKVNVPVTTEENCRKAYENSPAVINYKQICAGGRSIGDSCGGDSGGPLQTSLGYNNDVRSIQFGIVSFGPRFCGQEEFPGVYTRVDYYMDWILDNIRP